MTSEIDCITDKRISSPLIFFFLVALTVAFTSLSAWPQLAPGSMDVHWNEGSSACAKNPQPPLQVHQYNTRTFILRENLCATFEAPFMYLLIGSTKALLVDSGDVADAKIVPLADMVMHLLPREKTAKLPLLVVVRDRDLDHLAGDEQFTHLSNTQVVGFDIDSVRNYYKFTYWPNGLAQIDLGDRMVDVIPTLGTTRRKSHFTTVIRDCCLPVTS